MHEDVTQRLTENGFTVWRPDAQPTDNPIDDQTALLTHDTRDTLVARFVEGRKDETAVHVGEISSPSSYDIVFVLVDTGTTLVIDPTAVSNRTPRIPLDKPSPLQPVELSEWLS